MSAAWLGWLILGLISVAVCLLANLPNRDDDHEDTR